MAILPTVSFHVFAKNATTNSTKSSLLRFSRKNSIVARMVDNETAAAIIEAIESGATLKEATKARGITLAQFATVLRRDREIAIAYARAQEFRSDILAEEALTIADGDNDPAKARNQIGIRQWLAGKWNSKRYGDRIDVSVTQSIDISATLSEARSRLLPVSDQRNLIDAQPIVLSETEIVNALDMKSDAPDIFGKNR